jgi:hypothetical protein
VNEILGTLCIVLLVAAYAERARALGCELRALCEHMADGEVGVRQEENLDAELITRDLYLRHLKDLGAIDFGGIEDLGS